MALIKGKYLKVETWLAISGVGLVQTGKPAAGGGREPAGGSSFILSVVPVEARAGRADRETNGHSTTWQPTLDRSGPRTGCRAEPLRSAYEMSFNK